MSTTKETKSFDASARKIQRQIAKLAAGEIEGTDERKISAAINRLDDQANKPEIRGESHLRDYADAVIRDLRGKKAQASEAGYQARQERRAKESFELGRQIREENRKAIYDGKVHGDTEALRKGYI